MMEQGSPSALSCKNDQLAEFVQDLLIQMDPSKSLGTFKSLWDLVELI